MTNKCRKDEKKCCYLSFTHHKKCVSVPLHMLQTINAFFSVFSSFFDHLFIFIFFWFARQTLILSCFVSHSSFVSCINDTYLSIFVYTDIYTKVATFLFIFLFTPVHRLFWLFYFRCAPETHSYMSQNEKFCWSPNINIIMLHFFISK